MASPQVHYREQLQLPWWLWLVGLGIVTIFAAELHLGAPGLRAWVPYAVLIPSAAAGLWWLGRIQVAVVNGELHVDDAHLPVRYIGEVVPLDGDQRRDLLGRDADPLAFVIQRPWISTAVKVTLTDPEDPTPYWVVSTRRPAALAAAVTAARCAKDTANGTAATDSTSPGETSLT